jgi:hypothetical protein
MSRGVWLLVAGFCGFVALVVLSAGMDGRIDGWGDAAFLLAVACAGTVAFINALRLLWRAG